MLELQEGGAGGQGLGNVLEQVTLPPPDLSSLALFHPVRSTPSKLANARTLIVL